MKKVAIYARVSTADQDCQVQLQALRQWAERQGLQAVEFTDTMSGAKAKRPGLDALMLAVRARTVDAVACVKLDRLARSVTHLVELAGEFRALGVDLAVLDQDINTATPTGRLTFHVLSAMAEFERDLIRERTMAGLDAARRRGKKLGRPPVLDKRGLQRAKRMAKAGQSTRQIAEVLGISQSAAHRALRG